MDIIKALAAIQQWVKEQIEFNSKHADVIAENAELRAKLENFYDSDEYKAKRKAQLDRDRAAALRTLEAVEEEERKLGLERDAEPDQAK